VIRKHFLLLLLLIPNLATAATEKLYCSGVLNVNGEIAGKTDFFISLNMEENMYSVILDTSVLVSGEYETTPLSYRIYKSDSNGDIEEYFSIHRITLNYAISFKNEQGGQTSTNGECQIYEPKI
jgi:hypothetical protein